MDMYQHDSATMFQFVLRGELIGDPVQDLEHAWKTAKSILAGKELVVDISGITNADPSGVDLLSRMRESGARLTAALTPASSMRAAGSSAASPLSGSAAGWKLNQRASASSLVRRRFMMIRLRRKALRKPLATRQKAASDLGSARRQPPTTRRSRAVMGSQNRRYRSGVAFLMRNRQRAAPCDRDDASVVNGVYQDRRLGTMKTIRSGAPIYQVRYGIVESFTGTS
jgi:ABC-type transporter Mla MlaB component